jgi:hypothetical protein
MYIPGAESLDQLTELESLPIEEVEFEENRR